MNSSPTAPVPTPLEGRNMQKLDATGQVLFAWNAAYPRMDIRSAPGTKVMFDATGGYESEQLRALKAFTLRGIYTVASVDAGSSSSTVTIEGIPGEWNTVLIAKAPSLALPAVPDEPSLLQIMEALETFGQCCRLEGVLQGRRKPVPDDLKLDVFNAANTIRRALGRVSAPSGAPGDVDGLMRLIGDYCTALMHQRANPTSVSTALSNSLAAQIREAVGRAAAPLDADGLTGSAARLLNEVWISKDRSQFRDDIEAVARAVLGGDAASPLPAPLPQPPAQSADDQLKEWGRSYEDRMQRERRELLRSSVPVQFTDAMRRMVWLHSPNAHDAEGYEWGVFRVKWNSDGGVASLLHTRADFADIDAAIRDSDHIPKITPAAAQPGQEADASPARKLPDNASPRQRQAHEQCRAVVYMARAMAEVHEARALILAHDPRLTEMIGGSTAYLMEMLGDALSNMDAVDGEEDEWLDPVFEAAHEMWPTPADQSAPSTGDAEMPRADRIEAIIQAAVGLFREYDDADLRKVADAIAAAVSWDASQIKQPGWNHVQQAFIDGAREARANPDAVEADFALASDGYTKRAFEEVDPAGEAALRTESWAAPAPEQAPAQKLLSMWLDEWELMLPPDARQSFRDDLMPSVAAIRAAMAGGAK